MTRICLRRAAIIALIAFAIAAGVADQSFAQSEPLLGTWKFISEKSMFKPGPEPYQNMTLNFSMTDRGLRNEVKGVDAHGRPISAAYMIVTDGKSYPVTGVTEFDSSSYTRVGDRNTVYVRQKFGMSVVVGSRMLSRDGKTLIFREKKVDSLGREIGRALLVFEKQ